MNRANEIYLAGFNAAVDLAERAGARILVGPLPTLRREHAAAGLLGFVDAARAEMRMANEIDAVPNAQGARRDINFVQSSDEVATREELGVSRQRLQDWRAIRDGVASAKPDRTAARAQGYSGDVCDHCGSMSMKRSGSCQTCEACGTTSGCS